MGEPAGGAGVGAAMQAARGACGAGGAAGAAAAAALQFFAATQCLLSEPWPPQAYPQSECRQKPLLASDAIRIVQ